MQYTIFNFNHRICSVVRVFTGILILIIFAEVNLNGQTEQLTSNLLQGDIISGERIDKSFTFFSGPTALTVEIELSAKDQPNQLLVEIITSTGSRLLKWQVSSNTELKNSRQTRVVQVTLPQDLTIRIFGLKSNPEGTYKIILKGLNEKKPDTTPPVIKAEILLGTSSTLKGLITDESQIKDVKINNQTVKLLDNGEFSFDISNVKSAEEITITASDVNGNTSMKTFSVKKEQINSGNGDRENAEDFSIKPKLYILAVGVSKYANTDFNLFFSAKDAKDFAELMLKQKGLLYRDVEVNLLLDEQATRDAVIEGLDWIGKQTTSKDVAMILLSGHGINDNLNRYYYAPHNLNIERLASTGVKYSDILGAVEAIAGKKIFFVDTCHSGNSIGSSSKRKDVSVDMKVFVEELSSAENGAIVFNSSTGKQVSLEDAKWGNGAFTKALIEGLSGKAAIADKRKVTINSLDLYISERVKQLTNGSQTPTTAKPQSIADFPIAVW